MYTVHQGKPNKETIDPAKHVNSLTKLAGHPCGTYQHQIISTDKDLIAALNESEPDYKAVAVQLVSGYIDNVKGITNLRVGLPKIVHVSELDNDGYSLPAGDRVEVSVLYETDHCKMCDTIVPREQEHSCYEVHARTV